MAGVPALNSQELRNIAALTRTAVRVLDRQFDMTLDSVAATRVTSLMEIRRPPAYPDKASRSGLWPVDGDNGRYAVWFESLMERSHLTHLAWTGKTPIATQPLYFE